MIVAIDPGKNGLGVAWTFGQVLSRARLVQVSQLRDEFLAPPGLVVLEVPQVYRAGVSKGDPNDLIDVAVAGAFAVGTIRPVSLQLVRPRQWKGTLNGDDFIETRIKPALTVEERARVEIPRAEKTLGHNVWDAVGLLLWKLGRLAPRKVYPR